MHYFALPEFADRGEEYEFLATNRWGGGKVCCPKCNTDQVVKHKNKGNYYCRGCAETYNNGYFNAATGTALAKYKLPLKAFLYAAVILNKGKYGLSTLELSKKLNVTIMTGNKICKRLGKLNRAGHGYILGAYAPKYPHKVTVLSGHSKQLAPDLPDIDCCHYPKTMRHEDLIEPNKALVIEKPKLNTKYYFDQKAQCIKIKKEFPVLTDFKNLTAEECEAIIKQILYPDGNQPCPHCARTNKPGDDAGYYRCKGCQHKYNWRTNTVFMHSKLSVKQILSIMAKLHNFRFSVSSYSLARELGITQKSAYFNIKKIRTALYHQGLFEETQSKLKGPVQYDDKTINKSTSTPYYEHGVRTNKRVKTVEKVTVCCLYDSHKRQFRHLEVGANAPNKGRIIKDWIKLNVEEGAVLFSDATTTLNEFIGYYNIMRVKHCRGEYARRPTAKIIYKDSSMEYQAKVSNNRVEGFWRKFIEQNNTTFQHRSSIKNISYYLSEAVKRFAWDGSLRNGLPVALDALVTAAKFYCIKGVEHLRKKYNPPDYFYATMLVN